MTKAIPVSPVTLANKSWRRSSNYLFAADKIACPIDYTEVPKASLNMPLAFSQSSDRFQLIALNGLLPDQNLYVDPSGRWLSDYVPHEYRLYPFLLAQAEDGRSVLCIDEDSGLMSNGVDDQPFFVDNEPTETIKNVMDAISLRQNNRARTQAIVAQLEETGLIKKWALEFKINNEGRTVDGLYCADENALLQLSGEQLVSLRDSSALALLYCQMLSMHQVSLLVKLLEHHTIASAQRRQVTELDVDRFISDNRSINFDQL